MGVDTPPERLWLKMACSLLPHNNGKPCGDLGLPFDGRDIEGHSVLRRQADEPVDDNWMQ
jgi:hypothetical protein